MSARVYGNVHGKTVLIRTILLPNTEKETLEEVRRFAEDFFGAKDVTVDIVEGRGLK